jgi:hypothetical protein
VVILLAPLSKGHEARSIRFAVLEMTRDLDPAAPRLAPQAAPAAKATWALAKDPTSSHY